VRILIVGLGQVSLGYDLLHKSQTIRSHLFAIRQYGRLHGLDFEIFAVDLNPERLKLVADLFSEIKCFRSLDELTTKKFDIAVNATPISESLRVTKEIIDKFEIKRLYVEKPAAANLTEVEIFNNLSESFGGIRILYPRRCLSSTNFIKSKIKAASPEDWKVDIFYSGSRINILTHFLDFLDYIFDFSSDSIKSNVILSSVTNTALENQNDHALFIKGPISIDYLNGGSNLKFSGITQNEVEFDFSIQIVQQVMHSAFTYLDIELFGKENEIFPTSISGFLVGAYQ
jgi:predicted dehydrogenase